MSYSDVYIQKLAERTIGQSRNPLWFKERVGRLMSTSALQLIRFSHQVKEYGAWGRPWFEEWFENKLNFFIQCMTIFNDVDDIPEVHWGNIHESDGFNAYKSRTGYEVRPSGVWIFPSGSMSCSPDGLVYSSMKTQPDGILEIKCPFRFRFKRYMTIYDYMKLEYINPDMTIRRDHKFYHRAQAEMYGTHTRWCDFLILTPVDTLITRVYLDEDWIERNVPIIDFVFMNYLLRSSNKRDEIVSRRNACHPRSDRAPPPNPLRKSLKRKHED